MFIILIMFTYNIFFVRAASIDGLVPFLVAWLLCQINIIIINCLYYIHYQLVVDFLVDRTIGRAFGTATACRLSVVTRLSSVTFCILAKRLNRFA